jgi:serine/threonine-protein kinase
MNTEKWRRVQALFDQASELSKSKRDAFLEQHCGDDRELFDEVSALLANDRQDTSGDRFTDAIKEEGADMGVTTGSWRGKRIGVYRIIDKLAEGGMGAVYLAARDDKAYEQKVAIKVISRASFAGELRSRFRSERQILANLDHPNIARLIDGGEDDNGIPYLVMEYVSGTSIDTYCDTHKLTVEERLKLFNQVCDAVQYAHQNLIIHRDIKPSNILVTEDGVPKLLDFGIAKPIEPDMLAMTRAGQRVLTPKHASPEQLLGEKTTTASDIYSLGVLLYELLSGSFPFDMSSSSVADIENVVTGSTPPPPSDAAVRPVASSIDKAMQLSADDNAANRRLSRKGLVHRLRGDLDAITLKAISRKPGDRYTTVRQLGDDLRRHLDNLPVDARIASLPYRWSKYFSRYRTAVLAVGSLLTIAIGASSFHSIQLATERDRAQEQAEKANKVAVLLAEILEAAGPSVTRGTTVSAEQLLDHGVDKIHADLATEPVIMADLLAVIGRTYRSLGLYQRSHDLVVESLEIRERLLPEGDQRLAESYYELGYTSWELRNLDESLAAHEKALALYQNMGFEGPNEKVAASLREVGLLHENLNRLDEAEKYYRAAFAQLKELYPDGSQELALTQTDLGGILFRTQRYAEAEPLIVNALEMRRTFLGEEHPDVAQGLNNIGFFYMTWGDIVAAETYMRQSLALRIQLYGEESTITTVPRGNLGVLLLHRGKLEEGLAAIQNTYDIRREAFGASHGDVFVAVRGILNGLVLLEKYEDAVSFGTRQLGAAEIALGPRNYVVEEIRSNLGRAHLGTGNTRLAREFLAQARDTFAELRGAAHIRVAEQSLWLADIDAKEGKVGSAIATYKAFLDEYQPTLLGSHPEISHALFRLGELHAEAGDRNASRGYFEQALTIYSTSQYPESPALRRTRSALQALQ